MNTMDGSRDVVAWIRKDPQRLSTLTWLMNSLTRSAGVAHAVLVSIDGIKLASSDGLPEDRVDQLSALASGLISLTQGAARCFDAGEVTETLVHMKGGVLLLMNVQDSAILAALAAPNCDLGQVGYAMALLVSQVGEQIAPDALAAGVPADG